MRSEVTNTVLLAAGASILAASLMIFPKEALEASIRGLHIWWDVVFPSLLPFFIVSELLIGFGVVTFIGTWLEPLMRPLFRVPGVGGFVWAMGLASGNPAGAKLTARLRKENKVNRIEAERLVSFTNSANPLFIFGAIAVGFFHNPDLGIILAAAHYLGNLCVGLFMRFYGRKEEQRLITTKEKAERMTLAESLKLTHQERLRDGRPLGKLLGDAVQNSIQTLLMIGGFIILFSVLNKLLSLVGIISILAAITTFVFQLFHLPAELSVPFVTGLFEMTLGAQIASEVTKAALHEQIIVTSFFLAFSGFSILAQVASILAETDIRFKPFFLARIVHGFFASFFALILWKPLVLNKQSAETDSVSLPAFMADTAHTWFEHVWLLIVQYGSTFTLIMLLLSIFIWTRRALG